MNKQQLKVFNFMKTNEWVIIINIIRILSLIGVCVLIYIMIKEIEAVKLLGVDGCRICMEKTGCNCFCI